MPTASSIANRVCIATFVLSICLASGCNRPPEAPQVDPSAPAGEVTVVFQYPDESQESITVEGVRAGETVIDVMRRIDNPEIAVQGQGDEALVTRIGERANAGADGWTFFVNDQWADRSAGIYPVEPGDRIVWKYGGAADAP